MTWGASAYGQAAWGDPSEGPAFDGASSAEALSPSSLAVRWALAEDVATPQRDLAYEVHAATSAGAPFTPRAVAFGFAAEALVEDLAPATTYYVRARARNALGLYSADSPVELAVTTPAGAPAVSNRTPPDGTPLGKTVPVSFDVTDGSGLFRRVLVVVSFPATGLVEVAHDGDAFAAFYGSASTRVAIGGGYRYAILRAGGWPAAPTFRVYAIDRTGQEG